MASIINVTYIDSSGPGTGGRKQAALEEAEKEIGDYDEYLTDLYECLPDAYNKLRMFMERGNCRCNRKCKTRHVPCNCNTGSITGHSCVCPNVENCDEYCCGDGRGCKTREVEDTVRIYDINPKAEEFKDFLTRHEYHIGKSEEPKGLNFRDLQEALYGDGTYSEQEQKTNGDGDNQTEDLFDGTMYHVITVSHLSPKVARLLGAKFDIPADFFNRHLPGTEAISGRLISRLPSSIQIDLDELYESTEEFKDLFGRPGWCGPHLVSDGHKYIREAIAREFLFRVGWDYFPVHKGDFNSSCHNYGSSSGYEVLMQEENLKNVFQFNLTHRISIYSKPAKHPKTAIIIFYPTLPMYKNGDYPPNGNSNVLAMGDMNQEEEYKPIKFKSIPGMTPSPSEWNHFKDGADWKSFSRKRENEGWESSEKQSYASAFDRIFRIHASKHFNDHKQKLEESHLDNVFLLKDVEHRERNPYEITNFVHLFALPVFSIVAANWARLIVRRSFDLDLLEWRPKERMNSRTIDEIKSRRVAITRHQRDLFASVEILRALMLEELGQKEAGKDLFQATQRLAWAETSPEWNRGRGSGVVTEATREDSWQRIYWDFFELKSSMDALEKRADKIQDSMVGQIGVSDNENAGKLNSAVVFFSIVILPFSIVGTIFSTDLSPGGPSKDWRSFTKYMLSSFATIVVVFLVNYYWRPVPKAVDCLNKFWKNDRQPIKPFQSTPPPRRLDRHHGILGLIHRCRRSTSSV